jgi:hypothetical protein
VCVENVIHNICRTDCNVMFGGMMFGWVVAEVGLTRFPMDMELVLASSVS